MARSGAPVLGPFDGFGKKKLSAPVKMSDGIERSYVCNACRTPLLGPELLCPKCGIGFYTKRFGPRYW